MLYIYSICLFYFILFYLGDLNFVGLILNSRDPAPRVAGEVNYESHNQLIYWSDILAFMCAQGIQSKPSIIPGPLFDTYFQWDIAASSHNL